jgi:hypothetical protein
MFATMDDAHREWHRNTGNLIGYTCCPMDACDPGAKWEGLDEADYNDPEVRRVMDQDAAKVEAYRKAILG